MHDSRAIRRWLACWLCVLCLLSGGSASGNWQEYLPEARLVGSGELRLFGLRVYSARLWSPAQPLAADTPFALELTYHRAISREQLVEASVREIRRLHDDGLSAVQLDAWREQMRQAFVDVEPGARITGVHLPGVGARFYVGRELQHEVRDHDFARAFFAIWLDPRTRNPQLRAQLLGSAAR